MTNYLIVANGPPMAAMQLKALAKDCKILALDGAADYLQSINIKPDILLGDFDSLQNQAEWGIQSDQDQPYVNAQNILIVPACDQNQTDLQKAIDYCDSVQASRIDIVCATDGRFDHTIANVRVLRNKHQAKRPLILHTDEQSLIYLQDEQYQFLGEVGETVGLFGFPCGVVTSHGLQYELKNTELKFAEVESTSNSLAQTIVTLEITGAVLLVAPLIK